MNTVDGDGNKARRSKQAEVTVSFIKAFLEYTLPFCLFHRPNEHGKVQVRIGRTTSQAAIAGNDITAQDDRGICKMIFFGNSRSQKGIPVYQPQARNGHVERDPGTIPCRGSDHMESERDEPFTPAHGMETTWRQRGRKFRRNWPTKKKVKIDLAGRDCRTNDASYDLRKKGRLPYGLEPPTSHALSLATPSSSIAAPISGRNLNKRATSTPSNAAMRATPARNEATQRAAEFCRSHRLICGCRPQRA